MTFHLKWRFLLPWLLLTLASCGDLPTYPVEGKITYNGSPLQKGSVAFWPDAAKGNQAPHPASSEIAADGTFALYTQGKEGAPVGFYKVTVVCEELADSTKPEKTKLLIPQKYAKKETTDLVVEVVEDPKDGAYDLKLK